MEGVFTSIGARGVPGLLHRWRVDGHSYFDNVESGLEIRPSWRPALRDSQGARPYFGGSAPAKPAARSIHLSSTASSRSTSSST